MVVKQKHHAKHKKPLIGISVMLSASVPNELSSLMDAQDILTALILFTQKIIASGGQIVFGGHPTVTPLVRKAALSINGEKEAVLLYQLRRFREQAPEEIRDIEAFREIHWIGSEQGDVPMELELSEMRDAMCGASQAAIFIGGKTSGYLGNKPGIRDEYERFLKQNPGGPVYLLGVMNGETGRIIQELEQQKQHEPNCLSDKERHVVYHENNIDLIAPIVVQDIARSMHMRD